MRYFFRDVYSYGIVVPQDTRGESKYDTKKIESTLYSTKNNQIVNDRIINVSKYINYGSVLLDIGCGEGNLLQYLYDKKNVKGIGYEISEPALEICREKGLEVIKVNIMEDDLELKDNIDYITLLEVVEFVPYPEKIIEQMKSLFPGILIISFLNSGYYRFRIRSLLGRTVPSFAKGGELRYRRWSLTDFKYWLLQLGFHPYQHVALGGIPILKNLFPGLFARHCIVFSRSEID